MTVTNPGQPAFHGYAPPSIPQGYRPPLAIVISRATGARGRSIAERVAQLLGWEYVDQESLEYLTQGPPAGTDGRRALDSSAVEWIENRLSAMTQDGTLVKSPQITPLVRGILEAVARQHCVILGRGAGRVIPDDSRLHVKVIAPLELRVALIAQMRRLSSEQAEQFIREKDRSRDEFLAAKLGADSNELTRYDLVINTGPLGVEASSQVIALAAKEKEEYLSRQTN